MPDKETIRKLAAEMAQENVEAEPSISEVYWFPDEDEIRLIEVDQETVPSDCVAPFYFRPAPEDGIPVPSGIALIRPDEVRVLELPEGWGSWDDAEKIDIKVTK